MTFRQFWLAYIQVAGLDDSLAQVGKTRWQNNERREKEGGGRWEIYVLVQDPAGAFFMLWDKTRLYKH